MDGTVTLTVGNTFVERLFEVYLRDLIREEINITEELIMAMTQEMRDSFAALDATVVSAVERRQAMEAMINTLEEQARVFMTEEAAEDAAHASAITTFEETIATLRAELEAQSGEVVTALDGIRARFNDETLPTDETPIEVPTDEPPVDVEQPVETTTTETTTVEEVPTDENVLPLDNTTEPVVPESVTEEPIIVEAENAPGDSEGDEAFRTS